MPLSKDRRLYFFECGKTFYDNENMSWKSKNLLYCNTCNTCGEDYIGQTGTHLTARMRVYRKQSNDPSTRNAPCCQHFDRYSKEIIKNYSFINFKPIQPPWDLSKRIISLNYFPKNSTNINICIYNQLYSSHSLYLYIYCCYCHILLNSVFSDLNVLYCIMTSWIYSFLEKTLIASLRHS